MIAQKNHTIPMTEYRHTYPRVVSRKQLTCFTIGLQLSSGFHVSYFMGRVVTSHSSLIVI